MNPELRFSAFLVFLGSLAFADEALSRAQFTQEVWKVGISSLAMEGLEENPELSTIIPRLVYERISTLERHEISGAERGVLAREILDMKELEILSKLSKLHQSRDDLLFNPNKSPAALAKFEEEIQTKNAELSYWREYSPQEVDIPDSIPVAFPEAPNGEPLWNVGAQSPRMYRQSNGLDMLVFGSITGVGDYYAIEIFAFERSGEKAIWEGVGASEDFTQISREISGLLSELILGRQWASLTIQTDPPDALITVNPGGGGIGYWSDYGLLPGVFSLEVTATGYKPEIMSETLGAGETRFIEVKLEPSDSPQILVRTIPTGANLRLGNIWIGRTPMVIKAPDKTFALTVEKEGYKKRIVPLYPDTERLTIPLDLDISDPAEELAKARKKLYNSIALFSFSLAPTVILIGVSRNYAGKTGMYGPGTEEYQEAYKAYLYTYGFMWGSVAINVGLFTNVLIRIAKYFKAVEALPY